MTKKTKKNKSMRLIIINNVAEAETDSKITETEITQDPIQEANITDPTAETEADQAADGIEVGQAAIMEEDTTNTEVIAAEETTGEAVTIIEDINSRIILKNKKMKIKTVVM